jgi:hypothetical protein
VTYPFNTLSRFVSTTIKLNLKAPKTLLFQPSIGHGSENNVALIGRFSDPLEYRVIVAYLLVPKIPSLTWLKSGLAKAY